VIVRPQGAVVLDRESVPRPGMLAAPAFRDRGGAPVDIRS